MRKKRNYIAGTRWSSVLNKQVTMNRIEVLCDCGKWVKCPNVTNACECGIMFNLSGQKLRKDAQIL